MANATVEEKLASVEVRLAKLEGTVEARERDLPSRLDRIESRLDRLDQKVDRIPWFILVGLLMTVLFLGTSLVWAEQQQEMTITGREIVERLTRLEGRVTRVEEGLKRVEQRLDDLRQVVLWGFGVTFAGIFALIGFVMWDRRTAINPAIRRIERIEEVLRRLSKDNPNLAETLRNSGLL
jgi:vacuolar-type H+-ATPase subunit I/STV1